MAEMINTVFQHSLRWLEPLAWMRVNIAYMRSEIDVLASEERETTNGLAKLIPLFEAAFARFIEEESNLFIEARSSERSSAPEAISTMLLPLMEMSSVFDDFKQAFHLEVMRLRLVNEDCSALALSHCCGAEIFNSHKRVCDAIGSLIETIEANLR